MSVKCMFYQFLLNAVEELCIWLFLFSFSIVCLSECVCHWENKRDYTELCKVTKKMVGEKKTDIRS